MGTHPVFLRLEGRRCVVLGGDAPAAAKAEACAKAGASVTVVAEELAAALRPAVESGRIEHVPRRYQPGDLRGAIVCYASLTDADEIARVRGEARREAVLLNVLDVPEACDFFSGAVVERGDLRIAIGTGGESPALAAHLRARFAAEIGDEFGALVAVLGALRRRLADRADRNDVLRALVRSNLLDLLRAWDVRAIDDVLTTAAGGDCTLAALGMAPGGRG